MEKLRNTLNKVLNLLAGLSMTVMVVLTTYQVIVRYIFNSPSTWSEELVGYLFGWSTMLGATPKPISPTSRASCKRTPTRGSTRSSRAG